MSQSVTSRDMRKALHDAHCGDAHACFVLGMWWSKKFDHDHSCRSLEIALGWLDMASLRGHKLAQFYYKIYNDIM
ncbi:MAG: hypothetical protein K6G50_06195 [bacterium]|nr:hypothetical protein [bacterium]